MHYSMLFAIAGGISALSAIAFAEVPTTASAQGPSAAMPLIAGHRGVPSEMPENTMISFREALKQNADAIETDLWLTSDGKIIISHDPTTKRTCGAPGMTISESTFDELRKLDAGKWKGPQFAGEKLPTLQELLEIVPPGKIVYLEVKCGPEIVPQLVKELRESKLKPEQIRIISFNEPVIPVIKKAMPDVQAYLLYQFKKDDAGHWSDTAEGLVKRAKAMGADGLDLGLKPNSMEPVTPELIAMAKEQGMSFHAWTIDDPALARHAIDLGAASLTTNRAGGLRQDLSTRSPATKPAGATDGSGG